MFASWLLGFSERGTNLHTCEVSKSITSGIQDMCQGNTNVASCKKKKKEEKLGAEPHDRFLTPCGEEQKEEEEEEDK